MIGCKVLLTHAEQHVIHILDDNSARPLKDTLEHGGVSTKSVKARPVSGLPLSKSAVSTSTHLLRTRLKLAKPNCCQKPSVACLKSDGLVKDRSKLVHTVCTTLDAPPGSMVWPLHSVKQPCSACRDHLTHHHSQFSNCIHPSQCDPSVCSHKLCKA